MSDTNIIATDAQSLVMSGSGNALVSLFELEISGSSLYFHAENTDQDIEFDGNSYKAFPLHIEGIEISGDGASNRPTLTLPNVDSILGPNSELRSSSSWIGRDFVINDLIGSRFTRRQTLKKYTGTGVTAYEFPRDVYVVDRIVSRTNILVELELASPFDFSGARVPTRIVTGKYCPWVYKGLTSNNLDVKSACFWTGSITDFSNNTYSLFFTLDDEPIINSTLSDVTGAGAWSSATSYSAENLVTYNGLLWMAKANNTDVTPNENSIYWKLCRTFTTWSSDVGVSYTVNSADPRKSSYVYHNNNVWRAVRAHTKNASIEPGVNSSYWTYGDNCGKLLSSCKTRYQAVLRESSGSSINAIPSVGTFNTEYPLPFGGFPGTKKFR